MTYTYVNETLYYMITTLLPVYRFLFLVISNEFLSYKHSSRNIFQTMLQRYILLKKILDIVPV